MCSEPTSGAPPEPGRAAEFGAYLLRNQRVQHPSPRMSRAESQETHRFALECRSLGTELGADQVRVITFWSC